MVHQSGRKKLNLKSSHRCSMLRNLLISLIDYGHVKTTRARAKELQRFAEKMVTIAREGKNFNNYRHVHMSLPYKQASIRKLFEEIAPKYVNRPGGYTRVILLGRRVQDTAPVARIEWV